ncbi:MAG TPA: pitrilysin family protein [Vicinamibacteria bacterium]|nr:pitrilysin family protein [Vicinamibacteria bacterium]
MTRRATWGVLAVAALVAPALASGQAKDWREIQKPPLAAFTPQQPKRIVLPNGLVIFLQEDHELPLVRGTARIRGGSREEPAAKVGLVGVYGQVWRTGGTKRLTGDQLDDDLEARGARVETGGGLDSTFASWDCLKESFDLVFATWVDLVRNPEFREDKIAVAKNQINTGIARRNDDASQIAGREARRLGYGKDSPYARVAEYASVAAVTRDDLVAWHTASVHPNNLILGVVGDFDSKAMEAALRKALVSWPRGPAAPRLAAAVGEAQPGVYFVPKDDVTQSQIRMVHAGIRRDSPDYFALEVMNEILGGGFSSRLVSSIRSKKGLAYSVGGGVGAAFDHPGLFQLSMGTKSGSTAAAIDALYEEVDNLVRAPATADELARAKDAILNSFVFNFDTKQEVMAERMLYEFYGYPLDFLERYRAGIEKVTTDDVARVARAHVHKDKLALLVVGKAPDFDRPLAGFGPVATLDIAIPEGAPAAQAASGSTPEGRALLAKVAEAMGGRAKLQSVRSVRQKASMRMKTPQGDMSIDAESLLVFPDKQRQQLRTPMGEMTNVVSPEASFVSMPMGTRDMPASQKENALKELRTNPIALAQRADDAAVSVRAAGSEKIGEVEARILELSVEGSDVRWFVDATNGRILRTTSHTMGPAGPAEQTLDYSDWRMVDGVAFAFKRTIKRNGEDAGAIELSEVTINPDVDPKLFEKPR